MTPASTLPTQHGPGSQILTDVETFLRQYVTYSDPGHATALALWTLATYIWPSFDQFPYLCITADTKRAGKTRCAEVLSKVCSNPRFTGASAASIFRMIRDESPVIFLDEAESVLTGETADTMREVMNKGNRRGQTISRVDMSAAGVQPDGSTGSGVRHWPVYCPKVFILIGDVYDTLRDRAIVIRMRRAEPPARYVTVRVEAEGNALGLRVKSLMEDYHFTIKELYETMPILEFLQDRDAEMWAPLFAICQVLAPERIPALQMLAVDMSTEKTAPARKYKTLMQSEDAMLEGEYSKRLLEDMLLVMDGNTAPNRSGKKRVYTSDVLDRLYALPLGPWRKFRGVGLTPHDVSKMLSRYGVKPQGMRIGGRNGKVKRGYRQEDIENALAVNFSKVAE